MRASRKRHKLEEIPCFEMVRKTRHKIGEERFLSAKKKGAEADPLEIIFDAISWFDRELGNPDNESIVSVKPFVYAW